MGAGSFGQLFYIGKNKIQINKLEDPGNMEEETGVDSSLINGQVPIYLIWLT